MVEAEKYHNAETIALLCVDDLSDHEADRISPLTPLFGQPLIHHLIKGLEKVGISRFCIGIDNVPGALLHYRDEAAAKGMDIEFVRDLSAIAQHYGKGARILVLKTDIVLNSDLLNDALNHSGASIMTVEERPENAHFERIDLNNRWSGLAVLETRTLDALPSLPADWDMASALLRQAIQDGVALVPLKQSELQSGNIRKLIDATDVAAISGSLHGTNGGHGHSFEEMLLTVPTVWLLPHIWSINWGRALVEWMFPFFASATLLLSATGFASLASACALFAVVAAALRRAARAAEYRPRKPDIIDIISWSALAVSIFALLKFAQPSLFDAAFLAIAVTALSVHGGCNQRTGEFAFLTPLTIALALLIASLMHAVDFVAKLLILFELCNQLRLTLLASKSQKSTD